MDVLVVDDEPLARQRLVRMLGRIETCERVLEAGNSEQALEAITAHDPDVVLLDVRMPGEDGLAAARRIAALEEPPAIVFCTAYDEFALDAFDTEAVGYLLKPVKQAQLASALEKAGRLNKLQLAAASERPNSHARSHISASTHNGLELIALDTVRCFIADNKYVTVHHTGGEHLIDESLKELEQEFASRYLRVHRKALVSLSHIDGMIKDAQGQYQIKLKDTDLRPAVSRRHVTALKQILSSL